MKYFKQTLFAFICGLVSIFSVSCATMWTTPNYTRATKELPADVSTYVDYKVRNYKFPDGRIADVYVFNHSADAELWQNCQSRKFRKTSFIQRISPTPQDLWKPTGPLTPIFEAIYYFQKRYGEDAATKLVKGGISPLSYYSVNDLGILGTYMLSSDSAAQACYQDSTGIYLLSIAPPTKFVYDIPKEIQKQHEGQFAYKVSYIPKEIYEKVVPVKLQPAKTQPLNPTSIPDSDRNLTPGLPTVTSVYYYDEVLAYQLQWLAVKVACKGVYDMAYTGNFAATNPADYYNTSFIKKYLVQNDGFASKGTVLFEGICFDYADFAYQEVTNDKAAYQNIANFWMVGTFDNPNDIIAYRLAKNGEVSDLTINRTPVVVFAHNRVHAHDSTTHHAWFWVQATDGTVYWVDPTFTNNSGRPVYGIVRNGQEIQLAPAPDLCVN